MTTISNTETPKQWRWFLKYMNSLPFYFGQFSVFKYLVRTTEKYYFPIKNQSSVGFVHSESLSVISLKSESRG